MKSFVKYFDCIQLQNINKWWASMLYCIISLSLVNWRNLNILWGGTALPHPPQPPLKICTWILHSVYMWAVLIMLISMLILGIRYLTLISLYRYMISDGPDGGPLMSMDVRDFVMTVGSRSPSPGGGSVSALAASLVSGSVFNPLIMRGEHDVEMISCIFMSILLMYIDLIDFVNF